MTFGKRLQELRLKAGLTQQQLADKVKIQLGRLRNHEQDIREPAASLIFAYAEAMGLTCSAFADCEFVNKLQQAPKPRKKK